VVDPGSAEPADRHIGGQQIAGGGDVAVEGEVAGHQHAGSPV
jgi:hypothetical protein